MDLVVPLILYLTIIFILSQNTECRVDINSLMAFLSQFPLRQFSSFRKRIGVYSYKLRRSNYYKNPHAVPLHKKETLKKVSNNK
jgi:hypothetical protein